MACNAWNHRPDAELDALWDTDPDTALLEWTYLLEARAELAADPHELCEWLVRKRFGDGPTSAFARTLGAETPADVGRGHTTFLGVRVRVGSQESDPHALHIFRLLHLHRTGALTTARFAEGVRHAVMNAGVS